MSLKKKILVILSGFFVFFVVATYLIQRLIIYPSFLKLESEEAVKDISRVVQGINREVDFLDSLVHEWSAWDDTYKFIENESEAYADANLLINTFMINRVNLVYFISNHRETVWGRAYNLETSKEIEIKEFDPAVLSRSHPLFSYPSDQKPISKKSIKGVMLTEKGPMLVASRPILNSKNEGPVRGSLIMGKLLNETMVKRLNEQIKVNFKIFIARKESIPPDHREALRSLTPDSKFHIDEISEDKLRIWSIYKGIENQPALLIYADIGREISRQGRISLQYSFLLTVIAGIALFIVILQLMQGIVVGPVRNLTQHIQSIKTSDSISTLSANESQDELGALHDEFNNMLIQLDQTRKKLLEQSYYSGMADMMAGILHNIRNSLSPIKGYAALLRSDMAKAPLKNIQQVKEELAANLFNEDRQKDLMHYLLLLVETCSGIITKAEKKLLKISVSVNTIETVLKDHQKWAYSDRPLEMVQVGNFLMETIDQVRKTIPENIEITLDLDTCTQDTITVHVSLLQQIFSKILVNASESIGQSQAEQGNIRIVATVSNVAEENMMHYKFYDNGEGISPDSLKMIFEHGFSTKSKGMSGIGLHWCANTINSMKGRIYAESEGPGKGACFHVLLPLNTDSIG